MPFPATVQLTSCHLVEQTHTHDLLWAWSYPTLTHQDRTAYTRKFKILLKEVKNSTFHYFHHADQWVYFHALNFDKYKQPPKTQLVAVVLCALDFNPERYQRFSGLLVKSYCASGTPQTILQAFLSIIATGKFTTAEKEVFYFNEFEAVDYFKHPKLNGIIEALGVDVILVYTALLLKRRVLVYHHDVTSLSQFVLSLPAFIVHREDIWDALYPFIENTETEVALFKDSKFHILGCIDGNAVNRTDLYDVYVNVPAAEVVVAPHGRESMTMTKTHKDIALFMVQLTEKKGFTERDIMQEINRKTKELIENLRMFAKVVNGRLTLSLDELRGKEFSTTLETFLISLAQAENIAVTQ